MTDNRREYQVGDKVTFISNGQEIEATVTGHNSYGELVVITTNQVPSIVPISMVKK